MASKAGVKTSKGGKSSRSSRQLRYLFAVGFLSGSGKGSARKVRATGDISKISGPAKKLAQIYADRASTEVKSDKKPEKKAVKPDKPQKKVSEPKKPQKKENLPTIATTFEESRKQAEVDYKYHNDVILSKMPNKLEQLSGSDRAAAKEAFDSYQGGQAYDYINSFMRGSMRPDLQQEFDDTSTGLKETVQESIKALEKAVRTTAAPIPDGVPLYRGVRGAFAQSLIAQHDAGSLTGTEMQDKAFMSTSTSMARAAGELRPGQVLMRMASGNGISGAPLRTGDNDEAEILMAPNTKIKIVSAARNSQGLLIVDAQIIEDGLGNK